MTRLTEHKQATRNGDVNNHIAEHHRLTNHNIDWDAAQCVTYSTNYFQRLTLESWFTNLEQTPLNRCQQLPAPYKRLIHDINITNAGALPGFFKGGGGGHTVSNIIVMAFSPRNIVGCLLKKGGGSQAPQDPPRYALATNRTERPNFTDGSKLTNHN